MFAEFAEYIRRNPTVSMWVMLHIGVGGAHSPFNHDKYPPSAGLYATVLAQIKRISWPVVWYWSGYQWPTMDRAAERF